MPTASAGATTAPALLYTSFEGNAWKVDFQKSGACRQGGRWWRDRTLAEFCLSAEAVLAVSAAPVHLSPTEDGSSGQLQACGCWWTPGLWTAWCLAGWTGCTPAPSA